MDKFKSKPSDDPGYKINKPDQHTRREHCRIRKENPVLTYGDLSFTIADDKKMALAYSRKRGKEEIIVVFNRSDSIRTLKVPVAQDGDFEDLLSGRKIILKSSGKMIDLTIGPISGIILRREKSVF